MVRTKYTWVTGHVLSDVRDFGWVIALQVNEKKSPRMRALEGVLDFVFIDLSRRG
jgi:hypothetical protein